MQFSPLKTTALLAGVLVGGAFSAPLALAQMSPPTTASGHADHLLADDHSWNGTPYDHYPTTRPMLSMIRLTIPAHSALPWHVHPYPNAGYVLEGTLTIEDRQSGKRRTFHQGEAFAESVNDVHRGVTGDSQTVLLLTYAGSPGKPTSVPLPGQQEEY
ncbi:cupin domain-containing protein [Gluconobacter sp. Dm-62]|uniref:cupin domain-containing protein n=1 Tax=Gluconobacter sp. Dm-62 TaxID=2799804 RepID=UPI001B8D56A6|nr:cupin domain-containing protein [Gluconobacter sp. Dm-62]